MQVLPEVTICPQPPASDLNHHTHCCYSFHCSLLVSLIQAFHPDETNFIYPLTQPPGQRFPVIIILSSTLCAFAPTSPAFSPLAHTPSFSLYSDNRSSY